MKCNIKEVMKEVGLTAEELLNGLVWISRGDIELSLGELSNLGEFKRVYVQKHKASRVAAVVPCEHVKVTLDLHDAKESASPGAMLSVLRVSKRLGIGRGGLTSAVRKKRAVPTKTEVGPKGRRMHYFSEAAIQRLEKQQKVLIDAGYHCVAELAKEFGIPAEDLALELRNAPSARDGFLLRRKGTPGYASQAKYYHTKSWAPVVKTKDAKSKPEAASA